MFKYGEFPVIKLEVYNSEGVLSNKLSRSKSRQPYYQNQYDSLTNVIDFEASEHLTLKKIFKIKNLSKDNTLAQIHNQLRLKNNQNFIEIKQVFEDHDCIYIFMEQNQLSLQSLLASRKRFLQRELVAILENLRKSDIFHGGINLGNLYIHTNMKIKLSGFGNSINLQKIKENSHTSLFSFNELTSYITPQLIDCNISNPQVYYAGDIWSIGVVIYTLLMGEQPFTVYNEKNQIKIASILKIKNMCYEFPKQTLRGLKENEGVPIGSIWKQLLKRFFLPSSRRIASIKYDN